MYRIITAILIICATFKTSKCNESEPEVVSDDILPLNTIFDLPESNDDGINSSITSIGDEANFDRDSELESDSDDEPILLTEESETECDSYNIDGIKLKDGDIDIPVTFITEEIETDYKSENLDELKCENYYPDEPVIMITEESETEDSNGLELEDGDSDVLVTIITKESKTDNKSENFDQLKCENYYLDKPVTMITEESETENLDGLELKNDDSDVLVTMITEESEAKYKSKNVDGIKLEGNNCLGIPVTLITEKVETENSDGLEIDNKYIDVLPQPVTTITEEPEIIWESENAEEFEVDSSGSYVPVTLSEELDTVCESTKKEQLVLRTECLDISATLITEEPEPENLEKLEIENDDSDVSIAFITEEPNTTCESEYAEKLKLDSVNIDDRVILLLKNTENDCSSKNVDLGVELDSADMLYEPIIVITEEPKHDLECKYQKPGQDKSERYTETLVTTENRKSNWDAENTEELELENYDTNIPMIVITEEPSFNCDSENIEEPKPNNNFTDLLMSVTTKEPESNCNSDMTDVESIIDEVNKNGINKYNKGEIKRYCTAELLGRQAYYVYMKQKLNFVKPTLYQRSLVSILFVIYGLGKGIARGLNYNDAYNLYAPILKQGYQRPEAARDLVFNFYTSYMDQVKPITNMVDEYLRSINGIITAEDIETCNEELDEQINGNPQYKDIREMVIAVGNLAKQFRLNNKRMDDAAITGTEFQYLANNKKRLKELILWQAAATKLLDKLTII